VVAEKLASIIDLSVPIAIEHEKGIIGASSSPRDVVESSYVEDIEVDAVSGISEIEAIS
jgi:hypothetical protein